MNIEKMAEIFKEANNLLGEESELTFELLEKNNIQVLISIYETAGKLCYINPFSALNILKFADAFAMELNINTTFLSASIRENSCQCIKSLSSTEKDGSTHKDKKLYVIEFDNNSVKIGIAKNYERRKRQVMSANGMNVKREYVTVPIKGVSCLESKLHKTFKSKRLNGEYFNADFEEIVRETKKEIESGNYKLVTL